MEAPTSTAVKKATYEPQEHSNTYKNPVPISPDLTADTQEAHCNIIAVFCDEMYAV